MCQIKFPFYIISCRPIAWWQMKTSTKIQRRPTSLMVDQTPHWTHTWIVVIWIWGGLQDRYPHRVVQNITNHEGIINEGSQLIQKREYSRNPAYLQVLTWPLLLSFLSTPDQRNQSNANADCLLVAFDLDYILFACCSTETWLVKKSWKNVSKSESELRNHRFGWAGRCIIDMKIIFHPTCCDIKIQRQPISFSNTFS